MSLILRESPPLRLDVGIETPDGRHARWGADDPNPANQPQDLTFGTSMPGGFADFSCSLARDPRRDYPDTEQLSDLTVRGPGGQVAYNGRLDQLPDTGGSSSQLEPQAGGWQAHLDDNNGAAMIYVDGLLSNWGDMPLNRQIAVLSPGANYQIGNQSTATDPTDDLPAIVLGFSDSWQSPIEPIAEAWYDAGVAGPIAKIWYSADFNNGGDANWVLAAALSADDAAVAIEGSGNIAGGGLVDGYFAPATPDRYALLQFYYAATPAGTDNATYQSYWRPVVYGNHGLTLRGADPGGVLASDVAAHALGKWCPKLNFTTGPNGTIQPSTFIIPQLAFTTPGGVSVIVKQVVSYELLDWAVWEDRTYWQNAPGQSAKTRNWVTRVAPAQLQGTGPNATRIYNGVMVSYTDAAGVARTVGPPGSGATTEDARLLDTDPQNPANQAGYPKIAPLSVGTESPASAIQIGQVFLLEQKLLDTSGQASLVGYVEDDHGVRWPAWLVRAGDTVSFVDARNSGPRRVVSTSYAHATRTNSIQLDQPPDALDALLARLGAVIAPLGF